MSDDTSKVDAFVARIKNHPAGAVLIVFGVAVIAVSSFTDAAKRMFDIATELREPEGVEVTVESAVVNLRWSALKAGSHGGLWHPVRRTAYENEIRLPLAFRNSAPTPARITGITLITESNGSQSTWESVYEADSAPLERNAPIEDQIRAHRRQLTPFAVDASSQAVKVIDFVPVDHPGALANGTYTATIRIRTSASTEWLDSARFSFTVPADFRLQGIGSSGAAFSRYNYWQTFPIDKP